MELDDDELQLQPDETEFTSTCCPAQWLLIANVMNTLSLVVVTLFLLSGLLFDIIGGQYASILGCSMLCVGIGILACLVHVLQFDHAVMIISPLMETSTFILGVILCDVGSFLVNVGFYGFLWHLPKQQALVLSLSNSCLSCASFLPLVLSAFMTWSGYNLSSSLGLYAILIFVCSGSVCYRTVPSVEEYRSQALKVLGLPIPRRSVKGLKGAIAQLREGISVLTEVTHAKFHKLTIAVSVFAFVPSFVYMSMGDPLGKEIFGEGNELGVLFLKINTTLKMNIAINV